MSRRLSIALLVFAGTIRAGTGDEVVIDFEQAEIGKPIPAWTEKGVVFTLAGSPTQSKAMGRIMFFPHLTSNHKGLLNAMALEQSIPVKAVFPTGASSVTVVFWGSTGCPALLEALDGNGEVIDKAAVAAVPGRQAPADPVPFVQLSVKAPKIAAIRFSGPRNGEFLAADEIRFTPLEKK